MASPLSGIRPQHDTWPAAGVGGVRGTGEANAFTLGGYSSAGCSGCLPLGCFELKTVPAQSPSFFGALLARDLLAMAPIKGVEEPSPKSVVGFDFELEVAAEQELASDQAAWQADRPTD